VRRGGAVRSPAIQTGGTPAETRGQGPGTTRLPRHPRAPGLAARRVTPYLPRATQRSPREPHARGSAGVWLGDARACVGRAQAPDAGQPGPRLWPALGTRVVAGLPVPWCRGLRQTKRPRSHAGRAARRRVGRRDAPAARRRRFNPVRARGPGAPDSWPWRPDGPSAAAQRAGAAEARRPTPPTVPHSPARHPRPRGRQPRFEVCAIPSTPSVVSGGPPAAGGARSDRAPAVRTTRRPAD
jgi:hypothetical protein